MYRAFTVLLYTDLSHSADLSHFNLIVVQTADMSLLADMTHFN